MSLPAATCSELEEITLVQDLSSSSHVQQNELPLPGGRLSSPAHPGRRPVARFPPAGSSGAAPFARVPDDFQAPFESPPGADSSPDSGTSATLDDLAYREFETLKAKYLQEYQRKYPNGPPNYPVSPLLQ